MRKSRRKWEKGKEKNGGRDSERPTTAEERRK